MSFYQLYSDGVFAYAAHDKGLYVYDITSEALYAYINYVGGFTTVAGNGTYVYLGTTSSGIKSLSKACVSGSTDNPYDLVSCLNDYLTYPYIVGNSINYLHANDTFLSSVSTSGTGMDIIKFDPQSYRSSFVVSGTEYIEKCFITNGSLYYTFSGAGGWELDKVKNTHDWSIPDKKYITGSGILQSGIKINDIYVIENTSGNSLFLATTSGVYIINEEDNSFIVLKLKT